MTTMVKIALGVLLFIGVATFYFLALIAATVILVKILEMKDDDEFNYVMTANVIQFLVMVVIIAEKVMQWTE